ncbi:hypothetical protein D9M72_571180 [compost metagenome]
MQCPVDDQFGAFLVGIGFERGQTRKMWKLRVDDAVEAETALDAVECHHGFRHDHDLAGLVADEAACDLAGRGAGREVVDADIVGPFQPFLA